MTTSCNNDVTTPLLTQPPSDNVYDMGFRYFQEKRLLAKEKGALWLLRYQLKQLQSLRLSAQVGLFWTCTYAFAVGAGLAGYFVVTMGVDLITQGWGWFLLSVPIIAGLFSGLLNFWVGRKEPTEMGFDLMKREDAADLPFARKALAWGLALVFTALLTAACAYGMWEFFGAVINTDAQWVAPLKYSLTAILGGIFALPELSICLKFNKKWLRESPMEHYRNLCRDVGNDRRYIAAYVACLGCVLVGAVFTALAMADMTTAIIPFEESVMVLALASLTGISFYADKSYTQVTGLYERHQGRAPAEKRHSFGVRLTRTMNALGNGVPAFLGGFIIGGVWLGLFTALCGFTTSFLSGAEGKRTGYEDKIKNEITATETDIVSLTSNNTVPMPEPQIETKQGPWVPATQYPSLYTPFYRTKATEALEKELLSGARASHSFKFT